LFTFCGAFCKGDPCGNVGACGRRSRHSSLGESALVDRGGYP
jgi:hypothetical protein